MSSLTAEEFAAIDAALRAEKRIEAIRLFRAATGSALHAGVTFVEQRLQLTRNSLRRACFGRIVFRSTSRQRGFVHLRQGGGSQQTGSDDAAILIDGHLNQHDTLREETGALLDPRIRRQEPLWQLDTIAR